MLRDEKLLQDSYKLFQKPSTSSYRPPEELSNELTKDLIAKTKSYLNHSNPDHSKDGLMTKAKYKLLGRGETGRARAKKFLEALDGLNDFQTVGLVYPLLIKAYVVEEKKKPPLGLSKEYKTGDQDLYPLLTPFEPVKPKNTLDLQGHKLADEYLKAFCDYYKVKVDRKYLAYAVCDSFGYSKEVVDHHIAVNVARIISGSYGQSAGAIPAMELIFAEELAVNALTTMEMQPVKPAVKQKEEFEMEAPKSRR